MTKLAHLAPVSAKATAGTEALCGYRLTGASPDGLDVCARCTELAAHPSDESLLATITRHEHVWTSSGTLLRPGGWAPMFACKCGEEAVDLGMLRHLGEESTP